MGALLTDDKTGLPFVSMYNIFTVCMLLHGITLHMYVQKFRASYSAGSLQQDHAVLS